MLAFDKWTVFFVCIFVPLFCTGCDSQKTSNRRSNAWTGHVAHRDLNNAKSNRSSQKRLTGPLDSKSTEKTKYIRGCYFTNWAQYRPGKGKFTPEDYEPGLCTHILFAFGWMNTDFTVRAYDPADLTTASWQKGMYERVNDLKEVDPELKTLLSIGGWTFGTELFKLMAATARNRKIFIDSALAFVRQHKFDGLDIDWEYPQGPDDKKNFALLAKELYEAFQEEADRTGKPRLLLAAAVSAAENTIDNGYDIPELAKYLDFVDVMTYDFHGAWETVTGMNSPLHASPTEGDFSQRHWNTEWAIRHWQEKGMPREKLVVGLPTYGRGWTVSKSTYAGTGSAAEGAAKATQFVQEPGVAAFYELCQMLENGALRKWDEKQQVPYMIYEDQWFSYDDTESFRRKIEWVQNGGYGGVFVWTLDFDDFGGYCASSRGKRYPLIGLIRDTFQNLHRPIAASWAHAPSSAAPNWQPVTFNTEKPPPLLTDPCQHSPDGFFAYPGAACSHFILCLHGSGYGMSCPPALEFSPSLGYCVHPPSDCNQRHQQHLDPTVPVTYWTNTTAPLAVSTAPPVAQAWTASIAADPLLEYSAGSQQSRPQQPQIQPATSNAGLQTASAMHTDKIITGASQTFVCPMDGFHPDPTDCARFYRCFISIPYEFHCPDGLLYNIDTQVCDAPMNVQCTH